MLEKQYAAVFDTLSTTLSTTLLQTDHVKKSYSEFLHINFRTKAHLPKLCVDYLLHSRNRAGRPLG